MIIILQIVVVTKQEPAAQHTYEPILQHLLLSKEKPFIAKLTGKQTKGEAQICLLSPEFGVSFKGLRGTGWYAEVCFDWKAL